MGVGVEGSRVAVGKRRYPQWSVSFSRSGGGFGGSAGGLLGCTRWDGGMQ